MSDLEEAELCSEKEAQVRHFHHCHISSVVMWRKRAVSPPREIEPPSQSEHLSARQMSSVSKGGLSKAVQTHSYQYETKVCRLLLRSQTRMYIFSV